MNNQLNPERERGILRNEAKALDIVFNAMIDSLVKPFQCFKCGTRCADWEGSKCETCGEFFCDDCLVEPVQAMAPECCHACASEAAAMEVTHATLGRPD